MSLGLNRNERLALRCIGGGNFTVRTLTREMVSRGGSIAEGGVRSLLRRLRDAGLVEASAHGSKSMPRDYWLSPSGVGELARMSDTNPAIPTHPRSRKPHRNLNPNEN